MSGASAEVVWDVGSLYDADPDTLDELYGPLPTNDMIVINVEYEDMDPSYFSRCPPSIPRCAIIPHRRRTESEHIAICPLLGNRHT